MKTVVSAYQTPRRRANLAVLLLFAFSATVPAAEFEGAAAILRKVAEQNSKPAATAEKVDENAKLRLELTEFRKKAAGLPPGDSAKAWLELVDRRSQMTGRALAQFE